jgi:hypothetical protein
MTTSPSTTSTRLEDTRNELVLGAVGRFWRASGDMARIDPERFREFAEPGWAKGALNFRVEEVEGRTVLTTETRVLCTDAGAAPQVPPLPGVDPPGQRRDPRGLVAGNSPARRGQAA